MIFQIKVNYLPARQRTHAAKEQNTIIAIMFQTADSYKTGNETKLFGWLKQWKQYSVIFLADFALAGNNY